ncbi:hypothetical protein M2160_008029 [Streptomyces sp. SAI-117]|nr:hypothetical protein [Streptomyces sp. SAI-041]MDH6573008.1 hypothetical protein [Streptomyces sp. SAI-117]MDH6582030.1 hypothetical protein [Streptomyces sp. SAI-133]
MEDLAALAALAEQLAEVDAQRDTAGLTDITDGA